MITIRVNGRQRTIAKESTMSALLTELGIEHRYCAVERNRQAVPRERHAQLRLRDGDEIEIVTLVGGG